MVRTQVWDAGTHINWNFLFNVLGQHIGCADLKIAKKSDKGVRQHPDHGRKLLLCIGNHIFCRLLLHGFTPMLVQVKTAKSQIVKQHI